MFKHEEESLPAMIAGLLPSTRLWMQQRGYIEYVIEDGQRSPKLTAKGIKYIEGLKYATKD